MKGEFIPVALCLVGGVAHSDPADGYEWLGFPETTKISYAYGPIPADRIWHCSG